MQSVYKIDQESDFRPKIFFMDHSNAQSCDKRIELHFDDLSKIDITNQRALNEMMVSQQYFLLK